MSDPFGLMQFAECEHKQLKCEKCGARSDIRGWQTFTGQDKELLQLREENESITARLAAAEAERAEERAAVKKAGIVFQRIGTDLVAINFPFNDATARLAAAEAAMKAAASLPGRLWLTGQLALAEFLSGEGGENLDYALEQYKAAKGGRDE